MFTNYRWDTRFSSYPTLHLEMKHTAKLNSWEVIYEAINIRQNIGKLKKSIFICSNNNSWL